MANTLLVSENSLKATSYIDRNVSGEILAPAIKYVQDDIVENLLGTKLYQKLIELVNSREIDLKENGEYKELLDGYLFDLIVYSVLAEIQVPLSYKTRNKGLVQSGDDKLSNAFMSEVKYIETHYRNKADLYRRRLSDWLWCNRTKFPELKASTKFWEKQANSGDSYKSNFYFGKKQCKFSDR